MSVRFNPDRRSPRRLVLEWWVAIVTFAVSLFVLGFAAGQAVAGQRDGCAPNYGKASRYSYPDARAYPAGCQVGW